MMQRKRKLVRGFTLMEMMVAVTLLIFVIIAVGQIFGNTSRAISQAQLSSELFSNMRAALHQLERDLAGLDRNGFLVIRSSGGGGSRYDQVGFLAQGSFANRTGNASGLLGDNTVAPGALVWWGHLCVYDDSETGAPGQGAILNNTAPPRGANGATAAKNLMLGRHATLLLAPAAGATTPYYNDVRWSATPSLAVGISGEPGAAITSCRVAVAGITPAQLMQTLMEKKGVPATNLFEEAANYCYRFTVPSTVYGSSVVGAGGTTLVNGACRMHPIVLQGVGSFAVEWTDGTVHSDGTLAWYGGIAGGSAQASNRKAVDASYTSALRDVTEPVPSPLGDAYTAVFSYNNKVRADGRSNWPKALRITVRATDPQDKLQGGRVLVQVVKLPE